MWDFGQWGWTGQKGQLLWAASSSLFILKTSVGGSWDSAAQRVQGYAAQVSFSFSWKVHKKFLNTVQRGLGVLSPNFYRPLPPPLEAPRLGGPEFMLLPLPQLLPLRPPLEGVPLPGGPPKGSSLWYPSWWSPSKELERPDLGTLWEGPGPPRPEMKQWFYMWLLFQLFNNSWYKRLLCDNRQWNISGFVCVLNRVLRTVTWYSEQGKSCLHFPFSPSCPGSWLCPSASARHSVPHGWDGAAGEPLLEATDRAGLCLQSMRSVPSPSYATTAVLGEGLKSTDLLLEASKKYKLLLMLITSALQNKYLLWLSYNYMALLISC